MLSSIIRFSDRHNSQVALTLPVVQNVQTAAIQTAIGVVDDILGSQVVAQPSRLFSLEFNKPISSPLKESLGNIDNPASDPYHLSNRVDINGVRWIEFMSIDPIVAPVSREDISTVLNISLTPEGDFARPNFVEGSKRADFMRRNFDELTPTHFFNKHLRDNIHSLNKTSGKKAGKRGGKDKKHSFLVHWSGSCHGNIDGCNSFYDAGITEDDLTRLAKGESDSVRITMSIHGNCKHIWKKKYGSILGTSRKRQVDAIANGADRIIPPSRRAKRNIMKLSPKQLAVGNHGSMATDREVQYNLNREAKGQLRKRLGLTNNMLANVINVCERIRVFDETDRKERNDNSKDYLGLVQDSGFHDGFKAELWTKECLKVRYICLFVHILGRSLTLCHFYSMIAL